ncbi:helix-turn-helix domain-containing protein [Streptomyces sp. ISL-10]|uniref:PucR family transcriptional regulator n=1 Tax=Streptomyces sp. ISL-10 TaxID=2819172 RepID=UPI001BEA522B|nr:helix-turn-helix domain-containing protein [Streptomyces sp. ISL-10]MBT2367272.1 helix-turn-helix domain-containing protein [Streptomyces sp. ISL-10]
MSTGEGRHRSCSADGRVVSAPADTASGYDAYGDELRRHLERLAEISLSKQQLTDADLQQLRDLAAGAASRGTALRVVVCEYFTSACRAWARLPGTHHADDLAELQEAALAVMRAVGDSAVALSEGYESAQRAAIRGEEASRREFVDDLLEGRTDLGTLAERAERFGLRLVGPHSVTIARAMNPFEAGNAATRYVEEGLTARFGMEHVLITTKDGLLVCVASGTARGVPELFAAQVCKSVKERCQVAMSRPRAGPSGIVLSYKEARSALDMATQLGLTAPVVNASDLLVFQVLGRDRAAITDLVATVLGGLEQARGGPEALLETLTTYFASGCMNTATARRLGLGVRTVSYRMARIHQLTGYDPTDPDQRYTLQTAALGARLLGWPADPLQSAD